LGIGGLQGDRNLDSWGALAFSAAAFIPVCFLAFLSVFPDGATRFRRPWLIVMLVLAAIFAILASTTNLVVYETIHSSAGLTRKTGPAYPLFSVYLLLSWGFALAVLVGKWRNAQGQARAQLQYLGIGLLVSVSTALALNLVLPFATGRSTLSWLGPYSAVIFLALVAHSIIHHRLLDLRLVIHRGSAYAVLILLIASAALVLGRTITPGWKDLPIGAERDVLGAIGIILLLLTPLPLRLLTLLLDTYLLRRQVDAGILLTSAARSLSRLMQPHDLLSEFHRTVTYALAADWVLVALDQRDITPSLRVPQSPPPSLNVEAVLHSARAFLTAVGSGSLHLVDPALAQPRLRAIVSILRDAGVGVVANLGRRDRPLGLLVLGTKRSGDAYFADDLARLEALLDIVGIALENALLYREQMRLLEYANRLIESLDSAVITATLDTRIDRLNSAALSLFGLAANIADHTVAELPSEVGWALILTLSTDFRLSHVEIAVDTPSGSTPVLMSTSPLMNADGTPDGALAVLTDLSATKELDRQRRRAEHLDALARFHAGIAHEIRTPLTAISSFVSMLPERFNDPDYRATAVRILPAEVTRIVQLADRLRSLVPDQAPHLVSLNLGPLVADAVLLHRSAATKQAISLSVECADSLPSILGNAHMLSQLLANLLRNAIDAMPTGGELIVEASASSDRSGRRRVILRVTDTGVGIDSSLRDRLFEPFFTTKASGTGLGLALCQRIVEAHGAVLTIVPSHNHRGTTVEICFPIAGASSLVKTAP
jgi:signal transduction histidine kinase